jgi:hypothetical protein
MLLTRTRFRRRPPTLTGRPIYLVSEDLLPDAEAEQATFRFRQETAKWNDSEREAAVCLLTAGNEIQHDLGNLFMLLGQAY